MICEEEILKLLKNKDVTAFNSLYEHYAPLLYGRIMMLTDDISAACHLLAKSFMDIWRDIELYDPAKTTLFTWMLQITLRHCQVLLQLTCTTMEQKLTFR